MAHEGNGGERFEDHAGAARRGILCEFLGFLAHNKKWWLLPIVLVLLAISFLVVLGGTALPWIYTLF